MGEFAEAVRDRLTETLQERRPLLDWETEHRIRRTPVDVVGTDEENGRFVAVELEWRRADPANNAAKLFYYADEGGERERSERESRRGAKRTDGEMSDFEEVVVCQLFSGYYDLASGGVSSKREVAEFVGETAAESLSRVAYHPLRLPIDPPKRGGERPEGWRARTDETAETVSSLLGE